VSYCRSSANVRTGASVYAIATESGYTCFHPRRVVVRDKREPTGVRDVGPDRRFNGRWHHNFKTLRGFAAHMERHYAKGECPRYAIRRIRKELKDSPDGE